MHIRHLALLTLPLAFAAASAGAANGESVYEKHCAGCHSGNADNTPQLGNAEHWQIRLRYGRKSLVDSVRHGHSMMPTLEGTLSVREIESAVDYIVQRAGGWPKP